MPLFSLHTPSDDLRKAMAEFDTYSADQLLSNMQALHVLLEPTPELFKELKQLLLKWGKLGGQYVL